MFRTTVFDDITIHFMLFCEKKDETENLCYFFSVILGCSTMKADKILWLMFTFFAVHESQQEIWKLRRQKN